LKLVPGLRRDGVWIPAFAGMTAFMALHVIATQPQKPESSSFSDFYVTIISDVNVKAIMTAITRRNQRRATAEK
jgi:hypothetical protein